MARTPKKKIALVPPNQNGTRSMLAGRPTDIEYQINRRAYELYSARGGESGHDLDDWLQAEKEIMHAGLRSGAVAQ
jgi:Protein of unknown function (DUF2934)